MKYSISSIIFLLNLLLFMRTYPQQATENILTLDGAIKLTLNNQPLLKQALEQVNAAEAKIKEQKSYYYPRIDGDLGYIRIGPVPTIEFLGHNFELAPANNYNANISISQLVYDFGKRNAFLELSKTYQLSAMDKIKLIKNNLAYQTIQSYYTILLLERSTDVSNEQISTLEKHLDLTQKKVASGSATDFDILTTKVKIADAQNRKTDIDNALTKQNLTLNSLIGWPSNSPFHLVGEFHVDSSVVDLESLLHEAFNQRPEMRLAKDAHKNAMVTRKVASLTDRPNLGVLASYGFKNGYQPDLNEMVGNWTAGIQASVPIFDGNLRNARVEVAEANVKVSEEEIQELQRTLKLEVEQAVADLEASRFKIKTSKVQVEHAEQAVARARNQYQDGVITNLDLIDAETSLARAKLMYLQVVYQNVLSYQNLRKATGTIIDYND